MWIIVVFCLLAGALLGLQVTFTVPVFFTQYLSIAILASVDSLVGGIRANFQGDFDGLVMITGFITNSLLAAGFAYVGDLLGVALYTAAVFVFGVRIFQNLAIIRRILLTTLKNTKTGDIFGG